MASKAPLVIPRVSDRTPKQTDLQLQVQKIIAQKGALRDISEASIGADLEESNLLADDEKDEPQEDEIEETTDARLKRLWDSRNEMIQRLDYVQMEIVSALDFVSLLLSNHSTGASASMSQSLKDVVPVGSLDLRRIQPKAPTKTTNTKLETVSHNLKSKNFAQASSRMLESSTRLEKEANQQARYWEQISELQHHGWPVSRLPSDSRSIVAHYGFAESAPYYRNRGLAVLRQNSNGELEIAQRVYEEGIRNIRVTIINNGLRTSCQILRSARHRSLEGIRKQLSEARDQLFCQELFYQLGREAQIIANQGAKIQNGSIEVSITSNCQIRISKEEQDPEDLSSNSSVDNQLAEFVANTLCMLLIAEHEASYTRRSSQSPQPLSQTDGVAPEYALLRPIIAQLRHHAQVRKVTQCVSQYAEFLNNAGLKSSVSCEGIERYAESQLSISMLRHPARSVIKMNLPSENTLALNVETYLAAPIYGTRVSATSLQYSFTDIDLSPTQSLDEIEDFIVNVITIDLEATILTMKPDNGKWVISKPLTGELTLAKESKTVAKVKINCSDKGIGLIVLRRDQSKQILYVWSEKPAYCVRRGQEREDIKEDLPDIIRNVNVADA